MNTVKPIPVAIASNRLLCFSLGTEEYAVPLLSVKEVIAIPEITKVPRTPNHFLGIINLRGQILSVIDLRTKLGITPTAGPDAAVIICDFHDLCMGVVVDSVNAVIVPQDSERTERPRIVEAGVLEHVSGIIRRDPRLILVLDISSLLRAEAQSLRGNP